MPALIPFPLLPIVHIIIVVAGELGQQPLVPGRTRHPLHDVRVTGTRRPTRRRHTCRCLPRRSSNSGGGGRVRCSVLRRRPAGSKRQGGSEGAGRGRGGCHVVGHLLHGVHTQRVVGGVLEACGWRWRGRLCPRRGGALPPRCGLWRGSVSWHGGSKCRSAVSGSVVVHCRPWWRHRCCRCSGARPYSQSTAGRRLEGLRRRQQRRTGHGLSPVWHPRPAGPPPHLALAI